MAPFLESPLTSKEEFGVHWIREQARETVGVKFAV